MDKNQIEALIQDVKENESTANVHKPYNKVMGRGADFEVEYKFDIAPQLEGVKPGQGMRCDFLYEGDEPKTDGIHMIWPELLDSAGNIIEDKTIEPDSQGRATMWILSSSARESIHRERIKVGTKGYWVIGSSILAKVTVTKILSLFENEE